MLCIGFAAPTGGLSPGATAGIVLGVLFVVGLIVIGVRLGIYVYRKREYKLLFATNVYSIVSLYQQQYG